MGIDIDKVVTEFLSLETSLKKGDKETIDGTDHSLAVSMDTIRQKFGAYDELTDEEGRIKIPLHESDSAELTSEYILYSPASLRPAYAYYNTEKNGRSRISPSRIDETSLIQQVRFWSSEYEQSSEPSYLVTESSHRQITAPSTVIEPRVEYTDSEEEAFYDRLCDFVSDQREADREETRENYEYRPFPVFRREHGGVPSMVPLRFIPATTNQGPRLIVILPDEYKESDFRGHYGVYKGNEVIVDVIESGEEIDERAIEESLPVEGIIRGVNNQRLVVELLSERCDSGSISLLESVFQEDDTLVRVGGLFNSIPYDRESAAVQAIRGTSAKREVITGSSPITFEPDKTIGAEFPSLNRHQSIAAERALSSDQLMCIHGPPGTGKTRTLVSLVEELVDSGKRVLACAHSNQATDNLLVGSSTLDDPDPGSLHGTLPEEINIARVGSNVENPVVSHNYWVRTAGTNVASADVVCTTMSGAADFNQNEFDFAVIDEASQASIPASLIPFNAAKRVVLAGDHKQLPPYSSTELEERDMEISLFEHIIERYGEDATTLLQKQYRMNESIAAFSNKAFYDGQLETAARNRSWTLGDFDPVLALDIDGVESRANGKSRKNEEEAKAVAHRVQEFREAGVESSEIGVITPYRGQIGTIKNRLSNIDETTKGVKIDTIDSFQGSEREAIIVSFVRSNENGNAGFLTFPEEGPRRLNVALTRARKQLTLIANWDTLCTSEDREDCTDVYEDLLDWLTNQDFLRSKQLSRA